MFTMDEKWWIKSIHYRWSMDDDNDLNHFRSDDLDIHWCISFCGWNVIKLKWISSMDNKLDDIWTSKNCMNYHVKYTIFVMKNYESFIDVLDYVRIDRCHLWSLKLLIIASSFSSEELRLYSNRLLPVCLDEEANWEQPIETSLSHHQNCISIKVNQKMEQSAGWVWFQFFVWISEPRISTNESHESWKHLEILFNILNLALVSNKTNIFHYYQQSTTTTTNLGKIEINFFQHEFLTTTHWDGAILR